MKTSAVRKRSSQSAREGTKLLQKDLKKKDEIEIKRNETKPKPGSHEMF